MPSSQYQVTISSFTGSTPCTSYDIYTGVTHDIDNATFVETVSSSSISGHTVDLDIDSSYTHVYLFIEHCDGHINSVPGSTPKLQGGYQVVLVDLRCNDCVVAGATPTPTNTPTVTSTSTPTVTSTSTPTLTPTAGATSTPTPTPTLTSTSTPTVTSTSTQTLTPTAGETSTPTPTPTVTSTTTPTVTPTLTLTLTSSESVIPTPTTTPCGECIEYYNNNGVTYTGINYTDCNGVEQINVSVGPGQGICVIPGTISGSYGFLTILGECGLYSCLPTPTPTLTGTMAPTIYCFTADNSMGQTDCEIEYYNCETNQPTIYNVVAGDVYAFCTYSIISDACEIVEQGSDLCVNCQCPQGPPPTSCYCMNISFSVDDYTNFSDDGNLYIQYLDCSGATQNYTIGMHGTVLGPCAQSIASYYILVSGTQTIPGTSNVILGLVPCTTNADCT